MAQEKLIKSKERVRTRGEVFTPEWVVKKMCDMVENAGKEAGIDAYAIDKTFCEPSCGNGNFLVEILARKYARCKSEKDGLKALASVVGIDIQADNCEEARERCLKQYIATFPNANDIAILMATAILQNNIICGDSLEIQRQWFEKNEGIEHDYNMSTMEWCKNMDKILANKDKYNAKQ